METKPLTQIQTGLVNDVMGRLWERSHYLGQGGMTAEREKQIRGALSRPRSLHLLEEIGVDAFMRGSTLNDIISNRAEHAEAERNREAEKARDKANSGPSR